MTKNEDFLWEHTAVVCFTPDPLVSLSKRPGNNLGHPRALSLMRSFILSSLLALCCASAAAAQDRFTLQPPASHWVAVKPEAPPVSLFEPDDKLRLFGVTFLVGIPDGIAPALSFHPFTNLLHIDVGPSALMSLGARGSVTFDPFDWIVSPTLTAALGYNGWADAPFTTGTSVRFTTTYINLQAGVEVGRRSRFRIFLRAGYSHLWINTDYYPSYSGKQATSSTSVRIGVFPSFNLGLTGYL